MKKTEKKVCQHEWETMAGGEVGHYKYCHKCRASCFAKGIGPSVAAIDFGKKAKHD